MRRLGQGSVLLLALAFALNSASSSAQTGPWLTLMGDPGNPASELVEADADSIVPDGQKRTLYIRVNRATQRAGRDGLPFRSYVSRVEVDCTDRSSRHVAQWFYDKPLWQGDMRQHDYALQDLRPLAFRDMRAPPREVIVQAVCRSSAPH